MVSDFSSVQDCCWPLLKMLTLALSRIAAGILLKHSSAVLLAPSKAQLGPGLLLAPSQSTAQSRIAAVPFQSIARPGLLLHGPF